MYDFAGTFAFIAAAFPIFLATLIPGFLIAYPILRGRLHVFEIACFGFILGLVAPPFFSFALSFIGVKYSFGLAIATILFTLMVGFALFVKERAFGELVSELSHFSFKREQWVWLALLLVMLFAFWVRALSIGPTFYEFDPYYYNMLPQYLITQGEVPMQDDWAWYPYPDSHRNPPLIAYITAQWYSFYTQGIGYDKDLLATIAGLYPPLVGALLCFLAFFFISTFYGRYAGLFAAAFMAVTPRLINKFAAGESEQQPWGIFAAFFFYAAYGLVISKGERKFAALAAIALLSVTLGSKADVLAYLVLAGYIALQSAVDFFRGKTELKFIELNSIVLIGGVVSQTMMSVYLGSFPEIPADLFALVAALIFSSALYLIKTRVKAEQRYKYFAALCIAGVIILAITPVGPKLMGYATGAAAFAKPSSALMMTVAEETPRAGELESALVILGKSFAGTDITTMVLFLSFIALCYSLYKGSRASLFFMLLIFPVSYVGLSKSKYVLHLTYAVIVAAAVVLGSLLKLSSKIVDKDAKMAAQAFVVFCAVLLSLWQIGYLFADTVIPTFSSAYYAIDSSQIDCSKLAGEGKQVATYLYCNRIPNWWLKPMEWIKNNAGDDERVISWWDYGHWINWFGQKKCITRNDHAQPHMDLEVADKFVASPPSELAEYMKEHKAKYALFDQDLIGKWGALNFLSCVYNNETNMSFAEKAGGPGSSKCEADYRPEYVYIPVTPTLQDYCQAAEKPMLRAYSSFGLTYCLGHVDAGGQKVNALFYESDISKPNRGLLLNPSRVLSGGREFMSYPVAYFDEPWYDGVSGWEDRKGEYYDSVFYRAFFTGKLEGFTQVYPEDGSAGPVRIYKLD